MYNSKSLFISVVILGWCTTVMANDPTTRSSTLALEDLAFADPGLQSCVKDWAAEPFNGYRFVHEVRELGCPNRGIRSLEGLEVFDALLAIDISNNPIKDYAPIGRDGAHQDLGFLWLWGNDVRCDDLTMLRQRLPRVFIGGVVCQP